MRLTFLFCFLLLIVACGEDRDDSGAQPADQKTPPAAYDLNGEPLYAPEPSEANLKKFASAQKDYLADPSSADNIIWLGRRAGYLADYEKAISIFSEGIEKHPEDARMYRHRGHRYISTRQFDLAIRDFVKAVELIDGKENEVEPDGMPNAQNIPVSTLHGNIWYHLGLAHYLQHDWENALIAYTNCRNLGINDDNIVSSTHWLFMILNRMNRKEEAIEALQPIQKEMEVIENHAYHKLCLFYKGEITLEELKGKEADAPANDAVMYGIANWYFYNDDMEKAKATYHEILTRESWNSFGFIAAEADAKLIGI